jgi:hypothetical protein
MRNALLFLVALFACGVAVAAEPSTQCTELSEGVRVYREHHLGDAPGLILTTLNGETRRFGPEPLVTARDLASVRFVDNARQVFALKPVAQKKIKTATTGERLLVVVGKRQEAIVTVVDVAVLTGELHVSGLIWSTVNGVSMCDRLRGIDPTAPSMPPTQTRQKQSEARE